MKQLISLLFVTFLATNANAYGDLENLAKQGYAVVAETKVDGDFEGCEYDKIINLKNNLLFECKVSRIGIGLNPRVYIMRHYRTGDIKVIIKDREYRGKLWKK